MTPPAALLLSTSSPPACGGEAHVELELEATLSGTFVRSTIWIHQDASPSRCGAILACTSRSGAQPGAVCLCKTATPQLLQPLLLSFVPADVVAPAGPSALCLLTAKERSRSLPAKERSLPAKERSRSLGQAFHTAAALVVCPASCWLLVWGSGRHWWCGMLCSMLAAGCWLLVWEVLVHNLLTNIYGL
jgi:hypothetical protein